jgi:hypothetical protein
MVALDLPALAPSSHTIGSASSALLARHQVVATTATVWSLTLTTPFTPGFALMASASKLTSLPPNTGHALMAAHSMPGSLTSIA